MRCKGTGRITPQTKYQQRGPLTIRAYFGEVTHQTVCRDCKGTGKAHRK